MQLKGFGLINNQLRDNQRGATLIEGAIVLPVLLITTIAALDLLRCSYIGLTTQFTVTRVLRDAVIGPEIFNVDPYKQTATPYEEYIIDQIQQTSAKFSVGILREQISIECVPKANCASTAGQPRALVKVEIRRPTRALFVATIDIQSIALAKNEIWLMQ